MSPIITGGNVIEGGPAQTFSGAGAPVDGTDEVQRITIGGTPEAGSKFRLTYDGWTTEPIAWSSTDATLVANVQAALDALAPLADGEVTVAEVSLTSGVGTMSVTFDGPNLSKLAVSQMTGSDFLQSDGTASTGTVAGTTTTPGVTATFRDAPVGAKYLDTTAGIEYVNTGSVGAPTWSPVETGAVAPEVADLAAAIPVTAVPDAAAATAVATTATAAAVAGTIPAGGTGATEGAYDTAANRDTMLATLAEAKASVNAAIVDIVDAQAQIDALVADVADVRSQLNDLLAGLRTAGIVTP